MIARRNSVRASTSKPIFSRSRMTLLRSSSRTSTFSPKRVGSVASRMSTKRSPTRIFWRPSCGRCRSAMFMPPRIFKRLTMADLYLRLGRITSCSTPSILNLTLTYFSNGSKWMSLAPRLTASAMMLLTSLTTGESATSTERSSSSTWVSSSSTTRESNTASPTRMSSPSSEMPCSCDAEAFLSIIVFCCSSETRASDSG